MADNIYGGTSIQVYPEPGVAPLTTPHRDVEAFLGYVSRFNSINFHAKDDDVREWRFNKQYDNWQDRLGMDSVKVLYHYGHCGNGVGRHVRSRDGPDMGQHPAGRLDANVVRRPAAAVSVVARLPLGADAFRPQPVADMGGVQ